MKEKEAYQPHNLSISMFGGLEITYGDQLISENINRSRKLWNLLAYIITYRKKNITQGEFIDVFWPDEDTLNPENALKTQLYRIRLLLKPINIENEDFIISSRGSYSWNNSLFCTIDVDHFEDNIKSASNPAIKPLDKISYYRRAVDLYKGTFLSNHSSEFWVSPLSTHYHSLYLEAVKTLAILLESEEMYDLMIHYCTKAVQIDPFDETLHVLLVRSLFKQGNNSAALKQYAVATDMLYKNLGVKPSHELVTLYHQLMQVQKSLETDLGAIQSDLKESDFTPGPYVCEYGFFQEAYRLESRQASREGRPLFISLMTITLSTGKLPEQETLDSAMKGLLNSITSCLRKGDVVSKYSCAQYVLLLPTANHEACNMIIERIISAYYRSNRKSLLKIQFQIEQLSS